MRVASNGAGYLVAWVDPDQELRLSPVSSSGTVESPDGFGVADGVNAILDFDSAGPDYLIVYTGSGDAGGGARAMRVSREGTAVDPDGFDLGTTAELSVAGIRDQLWLLVRASHADITRTLLEAQYIGTNLPPAPDNAVPPRGAERADGGTPADGGSGGDARSEPLKRDSGSRASVDGSATREAGGVAPDAAVDASADMLPSEAGGGAAQGAARSGASAGCGCRAARVSTHSSGLAGLLLALVLGVQRNRTRARSLPDPRRAPPRQSGSSEVSPTVCSPRSGANHRSA